MTGQTYQNYHKEYRQRPDAKAKRKAYQKKYKKGYRQRPDVKARRTAAKQMPETQRQIKANNKIQHLIQTGELQRQPCEVCNEPNAHAHHDDYDKPLEIRWLCPSCHGEHHSTV